MHLRVMRVFPQSAELDFDNHASEREKSDSTMWKNM